MFNNLSDNLLSILDKIKGKGHITDEDLDKAMREVRIALLEADVSLSVAKEFIESIRTKARGQEVIKSVMPGQMIIKIVHDELVNVLGGTQNNDDAFNFKSKKKPHVIMMVGLQGSGKTTTAGKLALHIRQKYKKNPLLVSVDTYRPGAQLQLQTLANQINVDIVPIVEKQDPIKITKRAVDEAKKKDYDVLIIDTAGRLQTDEALMEELREIKKISNPSDIFIVSDAMIGQEAAKVAKEFSEQVGDLSGIILTRTEGDARGGAALSMKSVTDCNIKFVGTGESLNALERFDPERAASMILGMGDIVSLVEKTSEHISEKEAEKIARKMEKGNFNMDDLLKQLRSIKKMGSLSSLFSMIPGINKFKGMIPSDIANDKIMVTYEAIINSMTKKERNDPQCLNASRRIRIAKGSGTSVQEINKLVKQFMVMRDMMKKMLRGGNLDKLMNEGGNINTDMIQKDINNNKKFHHLFRKR